VNINCTFNYIILFFSPPAPLSYTSNLRSCIALSIIILYHYIISYCHVVHGAGPLSQHARCLLWSCRESSISAPLEVTRVAPVTAWTSRGACDDPRVSSLVISLSLCAFWSSSALKNAKESCHCCSCFDVWCHTIKLHHSTITEKNIAIAHQEKLN